jgi:hypothetical protein
LQRLTDILRETATEAAPRQRKVWFLTNTARDQLDAVLDWADELGGRVCFVFPTDGQLSTLALPRHTSRSVRIDIIPTNSADEEAAYRDAAEFFRQAVGQFSPVDFHGIDLRTALRHLVNIAPEYLLCTARAVDKVWQDGFDHVVVWFEHFQAYYLSIIEEAAARGSCEPEEAVRCIAGGKASLLPERFGTVSPEEYVPSYVATSQSRGEDFAEFLTAHRPLEPGGIVVLAATERDVYLPHTIEAVRALRDERIPHRIYAMSPSIRDKLLALADADGIPDESILVVPRMRTSARSTDPAAITRALTQIIGQIHAQSLKSVAEGPLGTRTLDHSWRYGCTPASIQSAYGFCLELERIGSLLERDRPSCVYHYPHVTMYDPALAQLVRAHGGVTASSVFLSIKADYRSLRYPECDVMTVLGSLQTDMLASRGFPRDRIFELGAPLLDTEFSRWTKPAALAYLTTLLGRDLSAGPVILVATGGVHRNDELTWLRWLAQSLPKNSGVRVLIKLHQTNNPVPYMQLIDTLSHPNFVISQKGEIYPYLAASDIVISDLSHVGKLAVYAGRKLWVANISGTPYAFDRYDEQGVAHLAATPQDFADIVAEAAGEKSFERRQEDIEAFIHREFTANDGKARERMRQFFRSCLNMAESR